jgi:hypothetical protein
MQMGLIFSKKKQESVTYFIKLSSIDAVWNRKKFAKNYKIFFSEAGAT